MGGERPGTAWRRVAWVIAPVTVALLLWPLPNYVAINRSASLPGFVYWIDLGTLPRCGVDYIQFRVPEAARWFGGKKLLKLAAGCEGDTITHEGRNVYVNGVFAGRIKTHAINGAPLEAGPVGEVPHGHYYGWAGHPDSYDSRYGTLGWVPREWVLGRAVRVF